MAGATVTVTRTQQLVAPEAKGNPAYGDDATIPTYKFEFKGIQTTFTLGIDYMSVSNSSEKAGEITTVSVNYGDAITNVQKVHGDLVKPPSGAHKNMLNIMDQDGKDVPNNYMQSGVAYTFNDKKYASGEKYYQVEGYIGIRFTLSKDYSQNLNDIKVYFINREGKREECSALVKDQTAENVFVATVNITPYQSRVVNIEVKPITYTVDWAAKHGSDLPNSKLVWPGGTNRPSYSGAITPTSPSFTFPSAPASPIEYQGKQYYFKYWMVDGNTASPNTFQPGERVSDVFASNSKIKLGTNDNTITLKAHYVTSASANDPVTAEYTLKIRQQNEADGTEKYADVTRTTSLPKGGSYRFTAGESYAPIESDGLTDKDGTWSFVGTEDKDGGQLNESPDISGENFNPDTDKFPTFVYQHDQTITFKKGGEKDVNGDAPSPSSGLSYDKVTLTPSGVDGDGTSTLKRDGYTLVGWKNGKTEYRFDEGTNSITIDRPWGSLELEPMWEIVTVEQKLAVKDIDYKTETITFEGTEDGQPIDDLRPAEVSGTGLSGNLKQDGSYELTNALNNSWAKNGRPFGDGKDTMTVTLAKTDSTSGATVSAEIWHRPAAPENAKINTTSALDGGTTGTITVTPTGKESYEYATSNSTNAAWTAMDEVDGKYVASNLAAGTYYVRVSAVDNGNKAYDEGNFAGAAAKAVVSRSWTVKYNFQDGSGQDLSNEVYTALKAVTGSDATAAQAAMKAFFEESGEPLSAPMEQGKLATIKTHWSALKNAMSGYGMSVKVKIGDAAEQTYNKAPNTPPTINGTSIVTFVFSLNNVTLEFDYNGDGHVNWYDGGQDRWPEEAKKRVTPYGGNDPIGTLPSSSKDDNPDEMEYPFWLVGYRFIGWTTKRDAGDPVTEDTPYAELFNGGKKAKATIFGKWQAVNYELTLDAPKDWSRAYGYDSNDATADIGITFTGTEDVNFEIANIELIDSGTGEKEKANNFQLVTTGSQPLTGEKAIKQIQIKPADNLSVGTYTAKVQVKYSGIDGGLNLGENVKTAEVTITFKVTPAEADIHFGTIDYVNERILITGDQAPKTIDEAKKLEIEGMPEDFDSSDEKNWYESNGQVWLNFSDALDTDYDGDQPDGWASNGGTVTLKVTGGADDNHGVGSGDRTFNVRVNAPELADTSNNPRAEGEGAKGTAVMAAPADGRTYEHRHDNEDDKSWRPLNDGSSTGAATSFTDVAGTYSVRLSAKDGEDGFFASRAKKVEIEQWYWVNFKLEATSWNSESVDLENATVTNSAGKEVTLGKQIGRYTTDGTVDLSTSSDNVFATVVNGENGKGALVKADESAELPKFGADEGSWETPGYNLDSISTKASLNTGTNADNIVSTDGDPYKVDKTPAITGDTTVTLHFSERTFQVKWEVDKDDEIAEDYPHTLPTTQLIPWSEMVRTSMLNGLMSSDVYWKPTDTTWVNTYFGTGVSAPIDPITVSWESYLRSPWALKQNNGEYTGFQVGQPLYVVSEFNPTAYFKTSEGSSATGWRDAKTLTFAVRYYKNTGAFGVNFQIASQDFEDNFNVGNTGQQNRVSFYPVNDSSPATSQVKAPNGQDVFEANKKFGGMNTVFSGWFLDISQLESDGDKTANTWNGQDLYSTLTSNTGPWASPFDTKKTASDALDGIFGPLNEQETKNKGMRPVAYDHSRTLPDADKGTVLPEGADNAIEYEQYFFPDYTVPDAAPTTGDALPTGARVDLVARIENANVTPTLKLQPAGEQNKLGGITGTIDLTPEEYWLNTAEGKLASEKNATEQTPSFEITGVKVVNPSAENWLGAALGNDKTMGKDDSAANVTLDLDDNLAPGTYSATVQVSYTYTSTTNAQYQLTIDVPVEFTVTAEGDLNGSEADGYLATAHDFATTKKWADDNLKDVTTIAKYTGFKAWAVTDGVWSKVEVSDITSTPTSVGSASELDENNGIQVTITAKVDSHDVTAMPTIYLYDNGTVPGGEGSDNSVYVFANNAITYLPTKDEKNTGTTDFSSWLVELTEAAAFDTTAGWIKVTPSVTNTGGLRTAVPNDVKDDTSGESGEHAVTLNAFGTTTTATVTLDRAPYPGAPGSFEQDVDATTSNALAWTAAAPNDNVGTGSIAAKNNYVPPVAYKVTKPDSTDQTVKDTQLTPAESNTEYKVKAYHEQTRVYWGAKSEGDYTSITATSPAVEGSAWTRPAVPEGLNHSYDYENETLSYEDSYTEGSKQVNSTPANVTLSDELEDAATATTILNNVIELAEAAANGDPMPLATTAPQDVSDLAGTQDVERVNGTASQTFDITATGAESGLEAEDALTMTTVPKRAATPALSIEQPLASGDPAVITSFDPEYVNDDGTSLYQASTDNGRTWGNVTFGEGGAATVTTGTLKLDGDEENGYTWNIPSGNENTFQFRVLHEDEATANTSNAEAEAHFKSLVQAKPTNGGDFTVTEGASITAKDFTVGANELIEWGMGEDGTFSDSDQEFIDAAGTRAQVTIGNQQDDMDWRLVYTNARPVEGSYEVTFELYKNADPDTVIGSAKVTMTVVTSGGAQDPNASIYASDFVVGVDEVATIGDAENLAWTRSQARGTTKAGADLEQNGVAIVFAQDGTPITEDGQFMAGESYNVILTVKDSYSSATVTMTVYDHVTEGDTYLIASNDFMAGANELVEGSEGALTDTDAASRANVTLYERTNPAVAIKGVPGEAGNITVDLSRAWGMTAADSPIKDGAAFTAKDDSKAKTASNITVTTDGSGSVDGRYFIGANDYHLGRNQLSGLDENALAKLFFRSAGVTGKNAGTTLAESGYGTTWTVEVEGVTLGSESAWEKDSYQVTFTLSGEDAVGYAATVTMHLHDNGSTGEVDGTTYAIFSDNFDMDDDEYSTLFGADHSGLFERANVEVYQVNDNGFYVAADTNEVQVDTTAFPEEKCVAGATNAGPVVFYLGESAADAPRAESRVTVHGGYHEDENGNYIQAEHFVMGLNELNDSGWMPGETLTSDSTLLASVVGYANAKAVKDGEADPITSAAASGEGAWTEGTYEVTFTSQGSQNVTVTMTVYDNVYRPDPDDPDYDAENAYVVASNDFRISEAAVDTVTDEQLISMGEVAVWRASDLQTKLDFTVNDITVGRGNLAGKKAGDAASVDYTYIPGAPSAKVTSNVTIFADGGAGTGEDDKLASIWANRIITTQEQVDAITGDAASWLYEKAGVVGTDTTGAALGAYDSTKVRVTISDKAPTKDAIRNGAEVTFAVLDNDGNPTSAAATVPVVIYDDGGAGTDPNTGTTYEIGANDFRVTLGQLTEDGLLSDADSYSKLQDAARVVATMRPQGGATQTLGYADVSVGTVSQLDDLANARVGGTYPLTFTNAKATEAGVPGVDATVNVTVYGTGGENENGYFLYANSFAAKYADLTAEDADLFSLIYKGAQATAGQNDKTFSVDQAHSEVSINVKVGEEWISLHNLDGTEGFDNWLSDSYQVQFTYQGLSCEVTMLVGGNTGQGVDPTDPDNPDASIAITATSFATSLTQLGSVAEAERLGWLAEQANVQTMVNGSLDEGTVTYAIEGVAWPTATGDYDLTFTVTEGDRSASVTVTMSVFDRSSEDGEQGGTGDQTPVSDENYVIYSNDYTVSQAERDANKLTNDELVRRGGAVAYSAADRYNPLPATDLVAGTDALAAAEPGDTFPVPYTLAESYGSAAKAVSAVYMTKGGATIDPTDPTDPSAGAHAIYANDVYVGRDEKPEDWDFERVMRELVLRGVSSVVTNGEDQPLADALAQGKVQVYVGDKQLTADAMDELLGDWSFDELDIRFQHADNADAFADVTLVMRDHGGTVTDPDDPARVLYMVFSDDFAMSAGEGSLLSDRDALFGRANVRALGRRGDAMTPLAPEQVDWTTTLDPAALATGTHADAVTFRAPAGGEAQAESKSSVTVYDGGTQNESGAIFANDVMVSRNEKPETWTFDRLARELFDRSGLRASRDGADLDPTTDNVTISVNGKPLTSNSIDWAADEHALTFSLNGTELAANVKLHVRDSGKPADPTGPEASRAQIAANGFTTSLDSIAANAGALDALFCRLAQVTGVDVDGSALAQGDVTVTVDGTPVNDYAAWARGTYQVTFAVAGDPGTAVTVTMNVRDHGTDPSRPGTVDPGKPGDEGTDQPGAAHASIYANDFTVSAQTGLAGAQGSADRLAALLYGAAQVAGTDVNGADLTDASGVDVTINGSSLADVVAGIADGSWVWDNADYEVVFSVKGAPDAKVAVTMTVRDAEKPSLGGNDFEVGEGEFDDLTPDEIKQEIIDRGDITFDGKPVSPDEIEVTVDGKPLGPDTAWTPGEHVVVITHLATGQTLTIIVTIAGKPTPVPGDQAATKPEPPAEEPMARTGDSSLDARGPLAAGVAALAAWFVFFLRRRRRDDEEDEA